MSLFGVCVLLYVSVHILLAGIFVIRVVFCGEFLIQLSRSSLFLGIAK